MNGSMWRDEVRWVYEVLVPLILGSSYFTLPETNSSHPKMDVWNTSFLFGWPIFRDELLVLGRVLQFFLWSCQLLQILGFDMAMRRFLGILSLISMIDEILISSSYGLSIWPKQLEKNNKK